jgi:long-chain acyl-CoA synthetase
MAPPIATGLKKAIIQPGMFHSPPFSVEVSGVDPVEGETIPRRNAKYKKALLSEPKPGIATLYNVLQYARDTFGTAPALGSRALIKEHKETKTTTVRVGDEEQMVDKTWTYYEIEEYAWTNYQEYFNIAMNIGQGLRKMGLKPKDRVHIYAATR